MTKQIRVKLGYVGVPDKDVATQGVAVVDGLTNNPKLMNPPIKPEDLKAQVEAYASLIATWHGTRRWAPMGNRDRGRSLLPSRSFVPSPSMV